jgi:Zn-dependent protease with chaperone function
MFRTALASIFSLTVLATFLLVVSGLVFFFAGLRETFGLLGLIALEAALFVVVWLVGPRLNDWIYGRFYGVRWLSVAELNERDAQLAAFVQDVCQKHRISLPKIGLIDDDNPQAFTYGSDHWNARMVFTRGIFTLLDQNERRAVAAHELGHIVHRDFILMTLAAFILTVLYVIGRTLIRMRGGRKNPLPVIGAVSLVFYYVGSYVLLFLSRAREYSADAFARRECGNGNDLSTVLVKIAYGIVTTPDTEKTKELTEGTRTLGIFDHKAAKTFGLVSTGLLNNADASAVTNAMVYDTHSLWAFWLELASSHPLTGKRIKALLTGESKPVFHLAAMEAFPFDRGRHYRQVFVEWTISNLWIIAGLACVAAHLTKGVPLGAAVVVAGLGLVLRALYRYPSGVPPAATVDELMSDPYSSPVRGKRCALEGKVVGKGIPGFLFSEDLMFQDRSGFLFLDYQHWFPWLGDLVFSLTRASRLVGKDVSCDGWFLRGFSQHLTLNELHSGEGVVKSNQRILAMVGALVVLVVGGEWWLADGPLARLHL